MSRPEFKPPIWRLTMKARFSTLASGQPWKKDVFAMSPLNRAWLYSYTQDELQLRLDLAQAELQETDDDRDL